MEEKQGFVKKLLKRFSGAASEEREKIEHELPFVVMIFTLLAASGVSPYEGWKKFTKLSFLPNFQKEAEEVIRQVEVLGKDPLTVMHLRAEKTKSKLYRNFLGGFVSSVRSGGKMVDYLKSELKSIFELRHNDLTRSVEKGSTLVEAYTVMLIVVLCTYILFVVFSSAGMSSLVAGTALNVSPIMSYIVAFLFMPVLSLIFILVAHNMQQSAFQGLKYIYKRALIFAGAFGGIIVVFMVVPGIPNSFGPVGLPEIAVICLVLASLIPAIEYRRMAKVNYTAEDSIPHFIRDVTEANKIGLSPEKSIVQATKRKGYGGFQKTLELVRAQIEWGIPLRKIFGSINKEIKSWFVIVNFAMMIETIEIGGNSTQSLEILAEYSEKERELQINRRALLKPYILLAFIWSALIAVTTTIVALTTYMMTSVMSNSLSSSAFILMQDQMRMFSVGIILQCWISGFFIGKISEGNLGAGFQYSATLAATAYVSLVLSNLLLGNIFQVMIPGSG
jgi:archaeal flagellar protein FlaJ